MKIKEITVGTGRKVGQPGYSSIDVSSFVTIELADGENEEEVFKKAWLMVEKQVLDKLKEKDIDSPVAAEVPESKRWLDNESQEELHAKAMAKKKLEKTSTLFENQIPSVRPQVQRKKTEVE